MKEQRQLLALYHKYLANECSLEEVSELMQYFNLKQTENDVLEQWILKDFESSTAQEENHSPLPTHLFDGIIAKISDVQRRPVRKRLWPRIAVAASILLVGSVAFYFSSKKTIDEIVYTTDIAPGKNGATLTLANGNKILINDALVGNIANQSGVKISKTANGQIIYEIINDNVDEITYNTLSTTRGEQTQVRLPDGTLVFLNAESSLKYPTSFSRLDKRQVSLTGEAYFEVTKDKLHAFVVKTIDQDVEVLGTHFNIDSYSTHVITKTTLVEGLVRVSSKNGDSKMLKPNQQALLSTNGIKVKDVEAEYEIAWKEGFFMFNNESLQSIMEKVSRWYNVRVVYEDESLKQEAFIGTISKYGNMSKVLNMLEKTKVAKFIVNKNVLTIKRMNN